MKIMTWHECRFLGNQLVLLFVQKFSNLNDTLKTCSINPIINSEFRILCQRNHMKIMTWQECRFLGNQQVLLFNQKFSNSNDTLKTCSANPIINFEFRILGKRNQMKIMTWDECRFLGNQLILLLFVQMLSTFNDNLNLFTGFDNKFRILYLITQSPICCQNKWSG